MAKREEKNNELKKLIEKSLKGSGWARFQIFSNHRFALKPLFKSEKKWVFLPHSAFTDLVRKRYVVVDSNIRPRQLRKKISTID